MYIYKITNLINNKIYIGQSTRSIESTKNYYGSGIYIKNALKKYGKDKFIKDILLTTNNLDTLNSAEQYFITIYNSQEKEYGYNLDNGGNNIGSSSEQTKLKCSIATKNLWQNDEYRNKVIKAVSKPRSEIGKQNISKSLIGNRNTLGKHWTLKNPVYNKGKILKYELRTKHMQICFTKKYTKMAKAYFKPNLEAKEFLNSFQF